MAISNYTRPQLLIRQLLDRTPTPTVRQLNAFVFGPQYDLFRYTNETERAELNGTAFEQNSDTSPSERQLVPYEGLEPLHTVDTDFVRLFGENLEGRLWLHASPTTVTDPSKYNVKIKSLSEPNKLHVTYRTAVAGTPDIQEGVFLDIPVTFGGTGYTVAPVVTIDGDGTGAKAVATISGGAVTAIVITHPGNGDYTTAEVTIADPDTRVNLGSTAASEVWPLISELHGRPIRNGDVCYSTFDSTQFRRSVRGTEREAVAAHYGSNEDQDNSLLAPAATNPASNGSASADNFTAPTNWESFLTGGSITAIAVGAGGSGYTTATVAITHPGGHGNGATATATISGGAVTAIVITNGGIDYTSSPTIVVSITGDGTGATAGVVTLSSDSVPADWSGLVEGAKYGGFYGERYTVTVTNSGNATSARVRIRSASGAFSADDVTVTKPGTRSFVVDHDALGGLSLSLYAPNSTTNLRAGDQFIFNVKGVYQPLMVSNTVGSIEVTDGGSSYTSAPTVTISGGGGSGATATAAINGLDAINVTTPGSGYTTATVNITGDGTGAAAVAIISGGAISQVVITNPGSGYTTSAATIIGDGTGAILAVVIGTGKVVSVTVTAGGRDYTSAPTVSFTGGSGSGAAATAILNTDPGTRDLEVSGTYAGPANTTYTITVVTGSTGGTDGFADAVVRVSDSTGIDLIKEYTVVHDTEYDLGSFGLKFKFPAGLVTPTQGGLLKGDSYFVHAVAEALTGAPAVIVLSGQAADTSSWVEADLDLNLLDIDVRTVFSGEILLKGDPADAPELQWEAGDASTGGILVRHDLKLNVPERDSDFEWVPVQNSTKARLFASWRGLVPASVGETIKLFDTEADIVEAFGKNDKDNVLSYAAVKALNGAQGRAIYVGRLRTNDLTGYTDVLRKAERIDGIYAMAPLSYDAAVLNAIKIHVDKMSTDKAKLWRRAYFGTKNPGAFLKIDKTNDGTQLNATVLATPNGNLRVIAEDADFLTNDIAAGDLFRINFGVNEWDEPTYEEYEILEVLEEDELILKTGPSSPISAAIKAEIWKPDTASSQVEFVAARSESYEDRRIVSVWSDDPYDVNADDVIEPVELFFICSEVAGLRSAVFPQQGLTNTEILSAEQAPNMFTKYTEDELDVAAAGGTFIIAQEVEDGPLFIRHQLTTQTNFNALHQEDSVGTNLDEISYAIKDALQPYIGRRNATPETIEEIETKMRDILNARRSAPDGLTTVGPQIVNWADLVVEIDDTFKDRINVSVRLELPLPINNIIVTLNATTVSDETLAATAQ